LDDAYAVPGSLEVALWLFAKRADAEG